MKAYINTPIYQTYLMQVDQTHQLYVEECGNPNGQPVLFLHGGPGGSVSEKSRRFFDPEHYRIILFDQRGTGKSKPFLSLENNTVLDSVEDIEKIRQFLKIDQWILFGGSYGTTLALAYAIHYPHTVQHLVLRGIFLGRQSDIDWLFQEGASYFYPEEFQKFKRFIPIDEQHDLVNAYYQRMLDANPEISDEACYQWSQWESAIVKLVQDPSDLGHPVTDGDRSIGLLESHYFANKMFWKEDNYLLNRVDRIRDIPMSIVHGRFDVDCRPSGAFELSQLCPNANLNFVALGSHTPYDDAMFEALLNIMEHLKAN